MSHLSKTQTEELRQTLSEQKALLEERLSATADNVKPVSLDEPIGRLSRIDAMQQQAMAAENRRRMEIQLQRIISAQERVRTGAYGLCHGCEEPIAFARLKKSPETTLCVGCQSTKEK